MIHFYGAPQSSAGRTLWMLEELAIPYEYHLVKPREGTRTPEFLAIYPGGTVPVIDDDGFRLAESIAINFYLAEKYAPSLMGQNLQERALVYQWSSWAMTNLQPELLTLMFSMMSKDAAKDEQKVQAASETSTRLLTQLDKVLDGHEFLVADRFSVADVNAGSVVNLAHAIGRLGPFSHVAAWMNGLRARPAYGRITAG